MEDLNEAGGIYAVMNELDKKGLLNLDLMTCTGKTMRENIKGCVNLDPEVIRPIENPYMPNGGIAVLKGNLAPDTGIVKRSAVLPEMMVHEGPARVFDCEEDAIKAITIPVVEVHISDIEKREEFRHLSVTAPVCIAQIRGHGFESYTMGIDLLAGAKQ